MTLIAGGAPTETAASMESRWEQRVGECEREREELVQTVSQTQTLLRDLRAATASQPPQEDTMHD